MTLPESVRVLEDTAAGRLTEKPPYRVPSMAEIAAIPLNGMTHASLFAGCGGSCLGFQMAGCRPVWANEFLEQPRRSRPRAAG